MNPVWMLGVFEEEAQVLKAVRSLRQAGLQPEDVYMPYPVTEMPEALGLKHSRLGWVCFIGGMLGGSLMMGFQIWTSAFDWPMNIGGRPDISIPAFFPATFEFSVLLAGLGLAAAALWRTKLFPGKEAAMQDLRVTDDRFALLLKVSEADLASARKVFKACHAVTLTESTERPS